MKGVVSKVPAKETKMHLNGCEGDRLHVQELSNHVSDEYEAPEMSPLLTHSTSGFG